MTWPDGSYQRPAEDAYGNSDGEEVSYSEWAQIGEWPELPGSLIPLFPVGPLTPQSGCPHIGPIPRGSSLVCMVCGQPGLDGHPGPRRDPLADPPPDESPEAVKQRRRRQFAEAMATAD